jgi:hypothetical protein
MPGRRRALHIHLDDQTRLTLRRWMLRSKTSVDVARLARALLLLEQGYTYVRTATWVGLSEYHLRKWAKRVAFSEKSRRGGGNETTR